MSSPTLTAQLVLNRVLRTGATPVELAWLDEVHSPAGRAHGPDLVRAYTAAGRIGRRPLGLPMEDRAALGTIAPGIAFDTWTRPDAARALLLLDRAAALGSGPCAAAAIACYEEGDAAEQQSWLRAVSLLPSPAQFTPLVIDACRTNILPVFEAVACGNPFPSDHFPELNFNQMVIKALFSNVALARIVGLPSRRNPDLARMAAAYASERQAAGRPVPEDIGLAMAMGVTS